MAMARALTPKSTHLSKQCMAHGPDRRNTRGRVYLSRVPHQQELVIGQQILDDQSLREPY